MSIKRSKSRSSGGSRGGDQSDQPAWARGPAKPSFADKSWAEQVEGQPEESFVVYSMATRFQEGQLVAHPKFGKGIVTAVADKRIDVMFSDGIKKLGHAG